LKGKYDEHYWLKIDSYKVQQNLKILLYGFSLYFSTTSWEHNSISLYICFTLLQYVISELLIPVLQILNVLFIARVSSSPVSKGGGSSGSFYVCGGGGGGKGV